MTEGMWFARAAGDSGPAHHERGGVPGLAMQGWTGWHCCAWDVWVLLGPRLRGDDGGGE